MKLGCLSQWGLVVISVTAFACSDTREGVVEGSSNAGVLREALENSDGSVVSDSGGTHSSGVVLNEGGSADDASLLSGEGGSADDASLLLREGGSADDASLLVLEGGSAEDASLLVRDSGSPGDASVTPDAGSESWPAGCVRSDPHVMLDAFDYAAMQVQQNPRHLDVANAVNGDLFWTTFDRLGPIDGTWPAAVEPANPPLGYDAAQFVRYALTGSTEGRSPASWLVQVPNGGQFYVYVRANAGESSDANLRISVDDVVIDAPNARLHINAGPGVLDWFYVGKVSFSDATPSWIDLSLGGRTYDAIVLSRTPWSATDDIVLEVDKLVEQPVTTGARTYRAKEAADPTPPLRTHWMLGHSKHGKYDFAQTDWELLSSADLPLKARTLRNQISHQTFQVVAGSKGTLVEVSITDLVNDDNPSIVLNSGQDVSISILHAAERAAVGFGERASWLDGSGTWVSPAPQRKLDTWHIEDETSQTLADGDQGGLDAPVVKALLSPYEGREFWITTDVPDSSDYQGTFRGAVTLRELGSGEHCLVARYDVEVEVLPARLPEAEESFVVRHEYTASAFGTPQVSELQYSEDVQLLGRLGFSASTLYGAPFDPSDPNAPADVTDLQAIAAGGLISPAEVVASAALSNANRCALVSAARAFGFTSPHLLFETAHESSTPGEQLADVELALVMKQAIAECGETIPSAGYFKLPSQYFAQVDPNPNDGDPTLVSLAELVDHPRLDPLIFAASDIANARALGATSVGSYVTLDNAVPSHLRMVFGLWNASRGFDGAAAKGFCASGIGQQDPNEPSHQGCLIDRDSHGSLILSRQAFALAEGITDIRLAQHLESLIASTPDSPERLAASSLLASAMADDADLSNYSTRRTDSSADAVRGALMDQAVALQAAPQCRDLDVDISEVNGTGVQLQATSTCLAGVTAEYQFSAIPILAGALYPELVLQPFGSSTTVSWDPYGEPSGIADAYLIRVKVRPAGVLDEESEPVVLNYVPGELPRCIISNSTLSESLSVRAGDEIALRADGVDCVNDTPVFAFYAVNNDSDVEYDISPNRAFSEASAVQWTAPETPAQGYTVHVHVKGKHSAQPFDSATSQVLGPRACSDASVTLTPDSCGSGIVAVSAAANCSAGTGPLFSFELFKDGVQQATLCDVSRHSTCNVVTTAFEAGTYQVAVTTYVDGSASPESADVQELVIEPGLLGTCSSISAQATPSTASLVGDDVVVDAIAACSACGADQYAFSRVGPAGETTELCPYSSSSTCTWNTDNEAPGPYTVVVRARAHGASDEDVRAELPYVLRKCPSTLPPSTTCFTYHCDALSGVVAIPVATGTACELDACTPGICDSQGECIPTGPGLVDDGDPCTIERCDPELGPVQTHCGELEEALTTNTRDATEWLYSGESPIQKGVDPDTIELERASLIRGTLRNRAGDSLPSVEVSVIERPEFGTTTTAADGSFQLVVNGGGALQLRFDKQGFLSSSRGVTARWNQSVTLDEVILVPSDPIVTPVVVSSDNASFQAVVGSAVTDSPEDPEAPVRRAAILFPPHVAALMHNSDGSTELLQDMDVRITEFTVGEGGPAAMPADLPANTGYTYAFEVNADQAVVTGAPEIEFSEPLPYYVNNFLDFPVGTEVPVGSYNARRGVWIPHANGVVLRILGINGSVAEVDVDGDDLADTDLTAHGITPDELEQLAALVLDGTYQVDLTLWRVRLPHFTEKYDLNWPFSFPDDAESPPADPAPAPPPDDPEPCEVAGASIIECQNQVYKESIALPNTDYSLHYTSARTVGYRSAYALKIPLTDDSPPQSLKSVDGSVFVGGRLLKLSSFSSAPNQSTDFVWDGLDQYGRPVVGRQMAKVTIRYTYDGVYRQTSGFGGPGAVSGSSGGGGGGGGGGGFVGALGDRMRGELYLERSWDVPIGAPVHYSSLGGWGLDVHHHISPNTHLLLQGDGSKRDGMVPALVVQNVAGMFGDPNRAWAEGGDALNAYLSAPRSVAVGPDGSVYVHAYYRIARISPDGVIRTHAGTGQGGFSGDGGAATAASLGQLFGMVVASDGTLYFAESYNGQYVRKVSPEGIISRVAGIPGSGPATGDGGPATAARLSGASDVELGSDGSIYIAGGSQVRRIDANGIISTIAGSGGREWGTNDIPDGTHAMAARLSPTALAMGPDGVLYILHHNATGGGPGNRVYRLEADGHLTLVAGCATSACTGTVGMDAKTVTLGGWSAEYSLAVSPSGDVNFAGNIGPQYGQRLRTMRIDSEGALQVLFDGTAPYVEGEVAAQVALSPSGLAFGENTLVVVEQYNRRVTSIVRGVGGLGAEGFVASASGDELYMFSADGRHLETKDAFTHTQRYTFDYDGKGRLVTVTDHRSGTPRATTIERDADGNATALVAPFGQRTELTINADGYLETVEFPNADAYHMTYSEDGLITSFTNPMGGVSEMQYDPMGRITVDEDAVDGALTFARTDFAGGWSVERQTPLNRTTTHRVDLLKDGAETLTNTFPDGTVALQSRAADESRVSYLADGTTVQTTRRADPRWGSDSSVASTTTTMPSALQRVESRQRKVVLADALDPFSMNSFEETVTVNGRVTKQKYVPATRIFTTTSKEGRVNVRELDAMGRVVRTQSGGFLPFTYAYNSDGFLQTATRGTRVVQYGYFASGPAAGTLESILAPGSQLTTLTRDALGRITSAERAASVTSFAWDKNSNLTGVTPPGKPTHGMQYTPVNLLSEYQPPAVTGVSVPQTTYSYDLDRAIDEITRPDGIVVDHTYDAAGRLASVSVPGATITQSYYPAPVGPSTIPPGEAPGRLQSVSGPYGTVLTYTYDGSLPLSEAVSGAVTGGVSWTYNQDLVRTSQSVSTGSGTTATAYSYDGDLLTKCASPTTCPSGSNALTLTRGSQHGLVTGLTQGSVNETWSYNTYGELASKVATFGATQLVRVVYDASGATRDGLGRVVRKTVTRGGIAKPHQYTYDSLGRLSTVSINGVLNEQYTYDNNGNRLTAFAQGSGTSTAYYDDQDRLLSYGDYEYSYGANGELMGKTNTATSDLWEYTYDAFGNLLSVSLPDGRFIEYITDGRHRRVAKKIDGTTVRQWLYQDGLNPVAELDGSGALMYRYVYASSAYSPDFVVDATGAVYRVVTDQLGSPLLIVNVADVNDVLLEAEYSAFGERTVLAGDGDALTLGFAGGEFDADTGLTRFGARDYDPSVGRWTAKDPILWGGNQSNLYVYVGSDSVNFLDPDGRFGVPGALVGGTVGGVVGGLTTWAGGGSSSQIFAATVVGAAGGAIGSALSGNISTAVGAGFGAAGNAVTGGDWGSIIGGAAGGAFGGWVAGLPGAGIEGMAVGTFVGGLAAWAGGMLGQELQDEVCAP